MSEKKFPWSAVPAARSSAAVLRTKLWLVLGSLLFAAALGPLSFLLVAANSGTSGPTAAEAGDAAAFAHQVARQYLAGTATDLPVASDVDALMGAEASAVRAGETVGLDVEALTPAGSEASTQTDDAGNVTVFEIHHFMVTVRNPDTAAGNDEAAEGMPADPGEDPTDAGLPVDGDADASEDTDGDGTGSATPTPAGQVPQMFSYYRLSVTVSIDDAGRPTLAANPSLGPWHAATGGSANPVRTGTAHNLQRLVTDPVSSRVGEWAEAFASGDVQAFRGITGGDPSNYAALGGFSVEQLSLVSAAAGGSDSELLLRVRLVLAQDRANGFSAANEFDLLVTEVGSQDPKVVAWGPPGSAQTLSDPNAN